jgi:hypothetical protein
LLCDKIMSILARQYLLPYGSLKCHKTNHMKDARRRTLPIAIVLPNLPILGVHPECMYIRWPWMCYNFKCCPNPIKGSFSCAPPLMPHVHPANGHYTGPSRSHCAFQFSWSDVPGGRTDASMSSSDHARCGCGRVDRERRWRSDSNGQWHSIDQTMMEL